MWACHLVRGLLLCFFFFFATSVSVALSLEFCDLGFCADPSLGEWRALDSWPR